MSTTLIIIGLAVIAIFVIRELITWYWKINRIVSLQERTVYLLEQIENNTRLKNSTPKRDFIEIKVGDTVRLMDSKKEELKNLNKLEEFLKMNGNVQGIEGEMANVSFGDEVRSINLKNLEKVN